MAITKSTEENAKPTSPVIGIYEGECADANITNNNGLDITYDVWDTVFKSDEYKMGIENGWYIGFLGHPKDTGCQDFEHACIVMTEGSIDDNGKVYGKFNLIDTPVGRIVKTFEESGVKLGISVRGAGDVVNNSVDPDTFVFRGFDLVTFPAFPESIPEFTAIAASTDVNEQKKYQKICAAVENELPNINSCDALNMIQSQFPEQSEIYREVEERKCELGQCEEAELNPEDRIALLEKQVEGLTQLYLDTYEKLNESRTCLADKQKMFDATMIQCNRKIHAMTRICANQNKLVDEIDSESQAAIETLNNNNNKVITANSKLKRTLRRVKEDNLQYQQKIEASEKAISEKEKIICSLKSELSETVASSKLTAKRMSNLDKDNQKLQKEITASEKLISEYQDAYASLYAQAVGVSLSNISVTATTDVSQLQKVISSSVVSPSLSDAFVEPQQIDVTEDDENTLITV